jgi:hypothetical protein
MKLTPPQQKISESEARFRVAACGRRFGKSWLAMNEMAKFARFPHQRILACAPTYKQCKNIWWSELKGMLIEKNWVKKINESELMITLVNGSTITLRSTENYDALRGGKYNFIVLDEFADMNPDAWFQVLRPTLSDMQGHALLIGSPKGRNHFYNLWVEAGLLEDWESFQFTTLQGGNVPETEIEAAKRDLDERTFRSEYESEFVTYESVVFYNYSDENNLRKYTGEFTDRTPIFVSCDFNVSPITAGIWVRGADWLHAIDEIEIYGSNTLELVQEINRRYGTARQRTAFPDATGSRTNTNSMGQSDHIILQNNGFKLVTGKVNPNVNDSINAVNAMLKNSLGEHRLFLDPKCKRMRESFLKYVYKEGTRVPLKDNINDHHADHTRYIVSRLFPVNRETDSTGKTYRRI